VTDYTEWKTFDGITPVAFTTATNGQPQRHRQGDDGGDQPDGRSEDVREAAPK
jgi:hypothetical protein